jgi:hypothetical protein
MKYQAVITVSFIILFVSLSTYGQNLPDTSKIFRIETKDGNIFTGYLLRQDSLSLDLMTEKFGEIKIPQTEIKSISELKEVVVVNNEFWLPNPQSGRYFWAPNGYGLKSGSAYYQNIWVLYNQISGGISDNFSLGGGIMPLFLFAGAPTPVWLVPKISIPLVRDRLNVGVGALLGTVMGEDMSAFGLVYGTTTIGSRDKNLSIGFAYGFADGGWMTRPVINFSAMIRTGPRGYLISENYIIPYETNYIYLIDEPVKKKSAVLISLGGRTMIRNTGLDYSLWLPCNMNIGSTIVVPFLGITVPIGKNK